MFAGVGLCEQAVAAFTKTGEVKLAIDTCVTLNQWDLAVKLAKEHKHQEVKHYIFFLSLILLAVDTSNFHSSLIKVSKVCFFSFNS